MDTKPTHWLLGLCLLVASCSPPEDDPPPPPPAVSYDTVFPQSYLPAFPGSYWKYTDMNGQVSSIGTGPDYIKDAYSESMSGFVSDTCYVPVYVGIPLWGYNLNAGPISHAGSITISALLSESTPIGHPWQIVGHAGNAISRKVIARDTSISFSGQTYYPTIVVEEFYSQGPPQPWRINRRFYTQNIGMVREETYTHTSYDSLTNVKLLTEYFINF